MSSDEDKEGLSTVGQAHQRIGGSVSGLWHRFVDRATLGRGTVSGQASR